MNKARFLLLLLMFAACCHLATGESGLWRGIHDLSALYQQGDLDSIHTRTMELQSMAEAQNNYPAQAMTHAMLGTIASERGDKQTAHEEFTRVADIAERHHLLKLAKGKPEYNFLLYTLTPIYAHLSCLCDEFGHADQSLAYAKEGLEWAAANKNRKQSSIAVSILTEMLLKYGGDVAVKVAGDSQNVRDASPPAYDTLLAKPSTTGSAVTDTVTQKPEKSRIEYVMLKDKRAKVFKIVAAALACAFLIIIVWVWYSRRKKERETRRRVDESYREGQEQERSRLAKELHDGVSNQLLAVEMRMRDEGATSKQAIKLLSESREQVRRVSHELMTPEFEFSTLDEVIANYARELDGIGNCAVTFTSSPPDADWHSIPHKTALELYRVVQEAVSNDLRHGQPTTISIGMHQQPNGDGLTIIVSSDGKETGGQTTNGIGLRTMRQRIEAIGGQIEFRQHPFGNVVTLSIK